MRHLLTSLLLLLAAFPSPSLSGDPADDASKRQAPAGNATSAAPETAPPAADAAIPVTRDAARGAARRAAAVLAKGAENYPKNRQCFSCHHQTLPLMAMATLPDRDGDDKVRDAALRDAIARFTHQSFAGKHEDLREGTGIGGRALTVGYGLWTLDLAGWKRDDTTDAMVAYLLKTQQEDGHWKFHSLRPPAASSLAMTTAVAVFALQAYGSESPQAEEVKAAEDRAREWFRGHTKYESHEDLIGALWGRYLLRETADRDGSDERDEEGLSPLSGENDPWRALRNSQRADGGWAQEPGMESDAYATAQALVLFAQTAEYNPKGNPIHNLQEFERGVAFLLKTQEPDGSWHVRTRAKPVQVYFDNGDPHGKDQFISMMATSWAATALSTYADTIRGPLDSRRARLRAAR